MILSAPSLHRLIRRRRVMRTSCSCVSAALSKTVLRIRIFVRTKQRRERGYHCAICRNCSRSAARPAVNSSIRSAYIRAHVFCIAGRSWPQINTSARLLTLAAFAATHISRESFDTGSVTHQVHVRQEIFPPGSSPNERAPSAHDDTCDLSFGPDWAFAAKLSTSALHKDRGPRHS